jgi:uncharacterized protein (TIGR03083 family)
VGTDRAAWYRDTREAMCALVGALDDDGLATPVPATPGWDVRDVVAHVAGIVNDLLAGNLDGVGSDPWTAAQVARGTAMPFSSLLREWQEQAPTIEAQVDGWPPELSAPLVADLVVHDLDVRGALGRQDGRDAAAMGLTLDYYAHALGDRILEAGLAPLRLDTPEGAAVAGGDDATTTVRTSRFELVRALTGRRSADQVRAYDWVGDPAPYLERFSAYGTRAEPLVE